MTAETARRFEALEAQAQRLMSVLTCAGYEHVAPAIIQPASHFLDAIGEDLRARTYVFNDPEGEELCLRPDLTVPTCRLHLERHSDPLTPARYCYNGPAFRIQPRGASMAHPNEFRQAGLENFAAEDREAAEAEVLALTLEALRAAGVTDYRIRIGDLGLFHALLDALDLPARWRRRLRHSFGRTEAFRAELKRLVTDPSSAARGLPADLMAALDPAKPADAEQIVEGHLLATGCDIAGTRTLSELTESLLGIAADSRTAALAADKAAIIETYFSVAAPAGDVSAQLAALPVNGGMAVARAAFARRADLMARHGIDLAQVVFSADFGRNFAYYTGFVFEIYAPGLGTKSPLGGGGRYDALLKAVGASADVPAVGAALHTERILSSLDGGRA